MKIVATEKALHLVDYLISLKQADIGGEPESKFIPAVKKEVLPTVAGATTLQDGAALYANTCAACHQSDGNGLAGAFPPLAGSSIVNDANPELLIQIILQGYDARPEYGMMVGFGDMLSDEEIAAIATHERSSWGNNAPVVSAEDVKKIREYIENLNQ